MKELEKLNDIVARKFDISFEYPHFEIFSEPQKKDLLVFEKAARTCYRSEAKITKDSAEELLNMLIRREHMAMVEFMGMTARFRTSRGVTHELVRHRHISGAQESTRYVKYNNVPYIMPWWAAAKNIIPNIPYITEEGSFSIKEFHFLDSCIGAASMYNRRIVEAKCTPQEARGSLNNDTATSINVKANLREWLHIFSLRCASDAHPDIRMLMLGLVYYLQSSNPVFQIIFQHYKEFEHPYLTWFHDRYYLVPKDNKFYIVPIEDVNIH
jgi:thymidylate synthase (FAD)